MTRGSDPTGAVLVSESILAILPGADLMPEHPVDRALVFEQLCAALTGFRELGGSTIVDMGGLTTGRDAELLELLTEATGVEIIASTGFGPAWTIGSHFTNNVSPQGMTADRIADIFRRELEEGLLVPTRERLTSTAGIVSITQTASDDPALPRTRGKDVIEADTARASARAALAAGASVAVRVADAPREVLALLAEEGVPAGRTIVLGLDRADHADAGLPLALAAEGYVVGLDHVGWPADAGYLDADRRVALVRELIDVGLGDRVVVSGSAIGCAVELPAPVSGDFGAVLRDFAPGFLAAGGTEEQLGTILNTTPRRLLMRDAANERA
ncbi:phosphotriesterase [Microbacterium sp. A204]|uniref:phosphotriesterase family protein n=1 Tax=Microbacterium sp. A204 TaxID=3457321 RepID=UPI003FD0D80C